jgi:hypothetical protein
MTTPIRPSEPGNARLWAILVLAAALAFALSPFVTDPFTGFEPGRFPVPVDDPPIQPAGWAFSIWGVIYLWLLVGAGFGLFKRAEAADWAAHRPWAFASLAVGAIWLPVANASAIWATVLIVAMALTALMALAKAPLADAALARGPLGLYAGWLTAASCVSLATLAAGYGVASVDLSSWIALALALAVACTVTLRLRAPSYPAAAGWAAIGITVANWPGSFALAALAGAVLLLALTALTLFRA